MRYLWKIWAYAALKAMIGWQRLKIACSRSYTTRSGKTTKSCGYVTKYGERRYCELDLKSGEARYTLDDLAAMTVQCAWCAKPVFIGDLVTVYAPGKGHVAPEGAEAVSKSPLKYVGCTRGTCCELPCDATGQWVPDDDRPGKGKVALLAPPFGSGIAEEPPDALIVPA